MVRTEQFIKHPEVESFHRAGIELAAEEGEYDAAHEAYATGLDILQAEGHLYIDEPSRQVQKAGLLRDDGFVHVVELTSAVVKDLEGYGQFSLEKVIMQKNFQRILRQQHLERAVEKLKHSKRIQQDLKGRQPSYFSPAAHKHLRAESGATDGLIARAMTVGSILVPNSGLVERPMDYYRTADRQLASGDNYYYLTSNAARAAHQRFIEGSPKTAQKWLEKAEAAQEEAKIKDPENYRAAKRTYNRHKKFPKRVETDKRWILKSP